MQLLAMYSAVFSDECTVTLYKYPLFSRHEGYLERNSSAALGLSKYVLLVRII